LKKVIFGAEIVHGNVTGIVIIAYFYTRVNTQLLKIGLKIPARRFEQPARRGHRESRLEAPVIERNRSSATCRQIGFDLSMEYLKMSQDRLGLSALKKWSNK
jgi:hypothetical protein